VLVCADRVHLLAACNGDCLPGGKKEPSLRSVGKEIGVGIETL